MPISNAGNLPPTTGHEGEYLAVVGGHPAWSDAGMDSAVRGPASSVAGEVPIFDGTSGKLVKNSTLRTDALGSLEQHCADETQGDGWNVQRNGFWSFADADCDSGFVHCVGGVPKFVEQTFRGEDGRFWYLYAPEAKQNPLTVSDGGRVGINKPTNFVNYHTQYVNPSTGALNDMDATGTYTRPFNTLYEVAIAAAGATDTYKVRISTDDGATWGAYSAPAPCPTSFTAIDAYGVEIVFGASTGHNVDDVWRFTAFAQLPSAALQISPTMFVEVGRTTDGTVASPSWDDITFDMANLSTPATVFLPIGAGGTTKGMVYFGCYRKFNSVFVDVIEPAVDASIVYEYWNGSAWTFITGADGLLDQTFGLTHPGAVRWDSTLLDGWALSTLPGKSPTDDGYTLYWVRVRSLTVMSQAPTADLATPQGNTRFAVFPGNLSAVPTFSADGLGKVTLRKKPGTAGSALTVANLTDESYKATIEVETTDTSFNLYKTAVDNDHRMWLGYGHLDFWTTGLPAILRHKFNQGFDFYNNLTDLLFSISPAGALTAGKVGYEALVLADNDIPNKKYVDSLGGGLVIQGDWNAATNTPDISGTTTTGYAWNVAVAGSTDLGGVTNWTVGSLAVKTASGWSKIGGTPTVWGGITGTLSNQGDLQGALNAKVSTLTLAAWTGTNNITTLGTIVTGVWHGSVINKNYLDTSLTAQGNTFNGTSQLVQTTALGKYPALDGSLITNVSSDNTTVDTSGFVRNLRLTDDTAQKVFDHLDLHQHSVGSVALGLVNDNEDGTIDVASGRVFLYDSPGFTGHIAPYDMPPATSLALTDESVNYLIADYNGGTPAYLVSTNPVNINGSSKVLIANIYREGTDLHIIETDFAKATSTRINDRLINQQRFVRTSGLSLSESATRLVVLTGGLVYYGIRSNALTPFTSATDVLSLYYHDAGDWARSTITTYNNTQYDTGSALATLSDGNYCVNWVYRFVESTKHVAITLGSGNYTLTQAVNSQPPTPPVVLQRQAILVGRIVVKKGESSAYQIDSAFVTSYETSPVKDHNDLGALNEGDYQHLTAAKLAILDAATSSNTNSAIVRRDSSGNFSAGTITANLTGDASGSAGSCTGNSATVTGFSPTTGKVLTVQKTMTLTSPDDTSVATLPAGTKTLLATDGSAAGLSNFPTFNQDTTGTAAKATNIKGGNSTTLLGALPYQSDADTTSLLSPNTSSTRKFLTQAGTGVNGAAPAWDAISSGDVPTLNQDTTGSATYLKASATTGKISLTGPTIGTTRAKTVRDANDTVLELGGSYTPSGTWNWQSASVTWPTFNQSTSGTAAKATSMVGGNSTTLLGAIGYQSDVDTTSLLSPNTTTTRKFLAQTGTGSNGAAPGWVDVTNVVWPITTKTAAYPITAADSIVVCDTTSTAFTVTLPTAVGAAGKMYWIKRISAGTNRLTIATTSSQTIDGATTATVDARYVSLTLVSDGSNWLIL